MKWPASEPELQAGGYRLVERSRCKGLHCGAMISWYRTPAGKRMPLTPIAGEPGKVLEPHFASCPDANEFRKRKAGEGQPNVTRTT